MTPVGIGRNIKLLDVISQGYWCKSCRHKYEDPSMLVHRVQTCCVLPTRQHDKQKLPKNDGG